VRIVELYAKERAAVLIPIRHENMSARRWPVITLGLITLNVVIFLFTHFTMEEQGAQLGQNRAHLIMLAAMHPELTMPPDVQEVVESFHAHNLRTWNLLSDGNRPVADAWDARIRMQSEQAPLQEEMDKLASEFKQLSAGSLTNSYAFIPAHPTAISYLTANFLHGGWMHLIGNMWFLWLAGFVLEDTWGRITYSIIYIISGAAAMQFYLMTNAGSFTPTVGASGAVAALMGAFMVRFPKMKIQMRWLLGIRSLARGGYSFSAAAYWLLPLWLGTEILYGTLFGSSSGVAHFAHVGGFLFGALAALVIRYSGLESKANEKIDAKTTWTVDAEITQATDLMEKGQTDEAQAVLQKFFAAHPDSVDACNILQQIYWRKQDLPAYYETIIALCALYIKERQPDLAMQHYDEFLNAGGTVVPPAIWLDLARAMENALAHERAVQEYDNLAKTWPAERQAVQALISAARLSLKLGRPQDAQKFYESAAASKVPHLDWEPTIEAGLREAKRALVPAIAAP
jgi:membrane associated rhomboid family serine protease